MELEWQWYVNTGPSTFLARARTAVRCSAAEWAEEDSEIVAVRALLRCLDLTGHLVAADALHCQNETAQVILDHAQVPSIDQNRPDTCVPGVRVSPKP